MAGLILLSGAYALALVAFIMDAHEVLQEVNYRLGRSVTWRLLFRLSSRQAYWLALVVIAAPIWALLSIVGIREGTHSFWAVSVVRLEREKRITHVESVLLLYYLRERFNRGKWS